MPTARESVPNTALGGDELREVLRTRCDQLLANFGILSPSLAFKRVGYTITIALHLDNAIQQDHTITADSRRIATNLVTATPSLAAIEPAPLPHATHDAVVIAQTMDATVDSPNAERVRLGLPVPVLTRQPDGTRTMERIQYPADPTLGEGDIRIRDSSVEARQRWGQPEPPVADADVVPDGAVAAEAVTPLVPVEEKLAAVAGVAVPQYEADPLGNGDNAKVPR